MGLTELIENAQRAYRSMDDAVISEAQFIGDFLDSADVVPLVRCKECRYSVSPKMS